MLMKNSFFDIFHARPYASFRFFIVYLILLSFFIDSPNLLYDKLFALFPTAPANKDA